MRSLRQLPPSCWRIRRSRGHRSAGRAGPLGARFDDDVPFSSSRRGDTGRLRIFSSQSIQRQLLFSMGVLLLLIVLGGAWSASRTRLERRADVHAEAASMAAASAAYFDQYLRGLDSTASVLARHPAVVAPDAADCGRLLAGVLRAQPLIVNVVLRAPDGTLRCSGLDGRDAGPGTVDRHVGQVVSSGRPVVSGLTIDPVTHKPTVVMAYPVSRPVAGVIDFDINLSELQTLFSGIPLPGG